MSKSNNDGRLEAVLRSSLAGYAEIMAQEQTLLREKQRIYSEITSACIAHRDAMDGNFELSIGLESAVHKLTEDLIASTKNLKRSFDILHGTFGRYLVAGTKSEKAGQPAPQAVEKEEEDESVSEMSEQADGQVRKSARKPRAAAKSVEVTVEAIAEHLLAEMGKGARKAVAQNLAATVAYLVENGACSGEKLQEAFPKVSQQTFGTNMRRLRELGWVDTEGKARGMKYRVSEAGIKQISALGA